MWQGVLDAGLNVGLSIVAAAIVAGLAVLLTRRAARRELDNVRLQGELAAVTRASQVEIVLEQAKADTAQANQQIAATLARTTEENRASALALGHTLGQIAVALDKIHEAIAVTRVGMERVEHELRSEVKLLELTAVHQSQAFTVAVQAVKDLASKDIERERAMRHP